MAFFLISFSYGGPKSNFGTGRSDETLVAANREVEKALESSGYPFLHGYAWPDGTLNKYIKSADLNYVIIDKVNKLLPEGIKVSSVVSISPNHDPGKAGCKTVREYFLINGKAIAE